MKKIEKPIIELSNICFTTKSAVVDRLYLSVPKGDRYAVVYRNDENIALLLDILSGSVTPKNGKVFFKGDDVTGSKNHFGIVLRKPKTPRFKTVAEYCAVSIVKRGLPRAMTDILVKKELAAAGLSHLADTPVSKLSEEDRAMVFVFAAYMCSHELIVIDEPFSSFDKDARAGYMERLSELAEKSASSLLIFTKDVPFAVRYADFVMIADKNTASCGIIAVDKRKKERAEEQINKRLLNAYGNAGETRL